MEDKIKFLSPSEIDKDFNKDRIKLKTDLQNGVNDYCKKNSDLIPHKDRLYKALLRFTDGYVIWKIEFDSLELQAKATHRDLKELKNFLSKLNRKELEVESLRFLAKKKEVANIKSPYLIKLIIRIIENDEEMKMYFSNPAPPKLSVSSSKGSTKFLEEFILVLYKFIKEYEKIKGKTPISNMQCKMIAEIINLSQELTGSITIEQSYVRTILKKVV